MATSSIRDSVYTKQAILDTYLISDAFFRQPTVQHFNNLTEQLSILTVSFAAVYNRSANPVRNTILNLMRLTERLMNYVTEDGSTTPPSALELATKRCVSLLDPHVRLIPHYVYCKARSEMLKSTSSNTPTIFH